MSYYLYQELWFDGTSFQILNLTGASATGYTLKEHASYYKMKNGEDRMTAKLFYQLCIGDKNMNLFLCFYMKTCMILK